MTRDYEVAIIGAGPNGLTAAAYLARSGADVIVLEKRFERGGTMASDDYSTPFTYNQAQAALPLGADNPVVAGLGLAGHGVAFIEPDVAVEVLTRSGAHTIGRGGAGLGADVQAMFASVSRACAPALFRPPQPEQALLAGWRSQGEGPAADLAGLTPAGLVFRVAASAGADCRVSAQVTHVRRVGPGFRLSCADGQQAGARAVICTLDPRTTFTGLLDPALVPDELAAAGRAWVLDDLACFTAHFGIVGAPPATRNGGEPYLRLVGFGSVEDLDDHLAAVRSGRLPQRPAGLLSVTTAHDPLQASPGPYGPLHTLRFDSFAPLSHPDGSWDRARRGYRGECWSFLGEEFPVLRRAQLIAQFADAPGDLRRRFGTTGAGTVRQGALSPAQAMDLRPHPLCADTRTPVPGFYLGGGGVHPGVPGLLSAGLLAARAMRTDQGLADPAEAP